MRNILVTVIILFTLSLHSNAQHQYSAKLKEGALSLCNSNLDLESSASCSIGFELDYHYAIDERWGVSSGLGLSLLKSKLELNAYEYDNGMLNDSEGDPYRSTLYLDNWMESQSITLLEIPIVATFQEVLNKDATLHLFCDLGFRIGLPIGAKYAVTSGTYEDKGYYEQYDMYIEDIPGHFETATDYRPSGKVDLNIAFMLTGAAGVRYEQTEQLDIIGGLRFNTTLNNMQASSSNLTTMSADRSRTYNGLLNSNVVHKICPLQVTLEVGVSFDL